MQDISSMLVAEIASPEAGAQVIDVCAAPGGKALHAAEKLYAGRSDKAVERRKCAEE